MAPRTWNARGFRDGAEEVFVYTAANILNWRKWRLTISHHGRKVALQLPITARCSAATATASRGRNKTDLYPNIFTAPQELYSVLIRGFHIRKGSNEACRSIDVDWARLCRKNHCIRQGTQ